MKTQDQLLLEAAYSEVSGKVKELYAQIMPLAEKILGSERKVIWDLDEEDQTGPFKHFSQFGLRRITINSGSSQATPSIEFGNWFNEQLWGSGLSPYATTPKWYAGILEVLKKKVEGKGTEGSLDSLTDEELVSKYKKEFDKQFEGSEDPNGSLLKQLYQLALKRGGTAKKEIQSYAISKSELER